MSLPVMLYKNELINATLDTSQGAGTVNNIIDYRHYIKWESGSETPSISVTFPTAIDYNCIGIVGHNCWGKKMTITNGSNVQEVNIGSNNVVIASLTLQEDVTTITIDFSNSTGSNVVVGTLYLGLCYTFPYPVAPPYAPIQEKINYKSEINNSGYIIGIDCNTPINVCSAKFNLISVNDCQSTLRSFWTGYASKGIPFFFGYDLANRATDVIYARMTNDYKEEHESGGYFNFTLDMEGIRSELY